MGWEVDAISAKTNSTSGYEAERQKQKKRIHTVNPFCFVVFRLQSLLDFLESRVMKRKSINHCEKHPEMERWTGIPKAAGTAVRIFRETHAISAKTSSTTQDTRANAQGRIIGNKHRKGLGTSRSDVC